MYFHRKASASGTTLQLLESFRNAEGRPRHRVVLSLGNANIRKELWEDIARGMDKRLNPQAELSLFTELPEVTRWVEKILRRLDREGRVPSSTSPAPAKSEEVLDGVLIGQIAHTHTTSLGPALLGKHAWDTLRIPEILNDLGFNASQRKTAAITVISRLTDPSSEHALIEGLEQTSFPDLFGAEILRGGKDRFYRVTDKLLSCKDVLERHLRDAQKKHFGFKRTLLLYDLTNTHFEGVCAQNAKAKRGHNKQKRDDCPQVVVGMVFDENGIELAHETFSGNTNDGSSLSRMLARMQELMREDEEQNLGCREKALVVMDAGIASKGNLELLQREGFHYLVNDSRRGRGRYVKEFREDGFTMVPCKSRGLHVQVKMLDEENSETGCTEKVLLCRSEKRADKERGIVSSAETRFLQALVKLSSRIQQGKLKEKEKIDRAVGRLLAKNTRITRFYQVSIVWKEDSSGYELLYSRLDEKYQDMEDVFGCYVLRTNQHALSEQELWQVYTSLTHAEAGFKALKSDLGLRPNFHRVSSRVDAHIFVTVLAYHLQQFILNTLRNQGDHRSWNTIKRVLETHCYTTILCPTKDGNIHRLRRIGNPEFCQMEIYQHFNIPQMRAKIVPH